MRAISLHQPWATLIALGEKRIETRGWSTHYRGPLLICAAAVSTHRVPDQTADDPFEVWRTLHDRTLDGHRTDALTRWHYTGKGDDEWHPIPYGVAVATCRLVNCLPIVERGGEDGSVAHLVVTTGAGWLHGPVPRYYTGQVDDLSDQLPFGDFSTPGRFGWLLDEIEAIPEPFPIRGRQGLWTPPDLPHPYSLTDGRTEL